MSREEAIKVITSNDVFDADLIYEAVSMAIKALEQESCEDAISRKEVLNQIFYSTDNNGDVVLGSVLRHRIENLPSVKPQEPILDKIRAEIDRIEINGLVDEHTMFVRGGEEVKQMALNIIDKYKTESEENNAK